MKDASEVDIFSDGFQIEGLVVGAIIVIAALGIAFHHRDFAAELHRYYNSIPDPKWRPRWLPWQFRPTKRQALIMTWLAVAIFFGLGAAFVVAGLM